MNLSTFNQLDKSAVKDALTKCCGASRWVDLVSEHHPFKDQKQLLEVADMHWYQDCTKADYLEAFTHHPKIGDIKSLEKKFASTKQWAGNEQAGVNTASKEVLLALAQGNTDYENKFGYIFIVCATGKSAQEMLDLLEQRLPNTPAEEIKIAMAEQHKITHIRLNKLLEKDPPKMSQIPTHVLDTSLGKPGEGIPIRLEQPDGNQWTTLGQGITNSDGRIADLLDAATILSPGVYRMVFDTGKYFNNQNIKGFYPEVMIHFEVFDGSHYHVPLLLNPYGYSTYRGS